MQATTPVSPSVVDKIDDTQNLHIVSRLGHDR